MKKKFRMPLSRKQYVVYSLAEGWQPCPAVPTDAQLLWADQDVVARLFRQDSKLKRRFMAFLHRGCWGVFHVLEGQWVSYAWITTAGEPGPAHMPNAPERSSYWIFHCGTKECHRGRGFYKRSLNVLALAARQENSAATLFIDTEIDNLPSRKAIVSVGFEPYGFVNSWTLTVPKLKSWTLSRWQECQRLPADECRAA